MRYYRFFIQKYYRYLLFGLILTFCSCLGQMFFISLFGGDFRHHLELTHGELGWVYSMTTLMSGFFLLWLGPKIDIYQVSSFTITVLVILILAMFLISQVDHLITFFIILFCIRFCSQGMLGHIAMTTIARVFPRDRGKAIGIVSVGFSMGEAILPVTLVTLVSYFSWQSVWQILACILALIILPSLIYLMKKIKLEANIDKQIVFPDYMSNVETVELKYYDAPWTRAQVMKDRRFYLLMPALLSPTLILTGTFFSHIPLVMEKDWELSLLASCFAIFALSNLFGSLYFGKKIDEKGCFAMMPYVLPLLIAGIFSLAFISDPTYSVAIYMFCAGMAVGGNRVILNTIWAELYGVKHLGEIRGMVVFICIICAGISPGLFGYLLDNGLTMQTILGASCVYIMVSMLALKWVYIDYVLPSLLYFNKNSGNN
jgi:MFS family permease